MHYTHLELIGCCIYSRIMHQHIGIGQGLHVDALVTQQVQLQSLIVIIGKQCIGTDIIAGGTGIAHDKHDVLRVDACIQISLTAHIPM